MSFIDPRDVAEIALTAFYQAAIASRSPSRMGATNASSAAPNLVSVRVVRGSLNMVIPERPPSVHEYLEMRETMLF